MKHTFVAIPIDLVEYVNDISIEFLGAALSRKTTDKLYLQDKNGVLNPFIHDMPNSEIIFEDVSPKYFIGDMEDSDIVDIVSKHYNIHVDLLAKMDLDEIRDGLEKHPKNYKLINMDEYNIFKKDLSSHELKRNLCDLLGLNYNTHKDDIINELSKML